MKKACNSPGEHYQNQCPQCHTYGIGKTMLTICPFCSWNQGMTFIECRSIAVSIAGEETFFCMTELRCENCNGKFWIRPRSDSYCPNHNCNFDFDMTMKKCKCGPDHDRIDAEYWKALRTPIEASNGDIAWKWKSP